MKTDAIRVGLATLLMTFTLSAEAASITHVFRGVVDQGKADFTGSLVDISGRNYEVFITGDTSYSDTAADPDVGRFQDFISLGGTTVISIEGLGSVPFTNPDFLRKHDDGASAGISAPVGGGLVGVIDVGVPVGTIGDPNFLVPFSTVGIISGSIALGESIPVADDAPTEGVWFRDLDPLSVSATIRATPEPGSTLGFAVVAALFGGITHLIRKSNRVLGDT